MTKSDWEFDEISVKSKLKWAVNDILKLIIPLTCVGKNPKNGKELIWINRCVL